MYSYPVCKLSIVWSADFTWLSFPMVFWSVILTVCLAINCYSVVWLQFPFNYTLECSITCKYSISIHIAAYSNTKEYVCGEYIITALDQIAYFLYEEFSLRSICTLTTYSPHYVCHVCILLPFCNIRTLYFTQIGICSGEFVTSVSSKSTSTSQWLITLLYPNLHYEQVQTMTNIRTIMIFMPVNYTMYICK